MYTKNPHPQDLLATPPHPIIGLFFELAQLKNLFRQGWLRCGVRQADCESVAEHSLTVAILSYLLATEYRPDLDADKVLKLAVFHEVGEIFAGDIIPHDHLSREEKSRREEQAVRQVFACLPHPDKYFDIWQEYDAKETPEAAFVGQVDKLENALQTLLYERLGYTQLDEFWPDLEKKIHTPELKAIFNAIKNCRT